MLTYVFDLDGTICTQGRTGTYHLMQPISKMVEKVNSLYMAGHRIIIFTARGMVTCKGNVDQIWKDYGPMTLDWLDRNGVLFHELKFGKPAADFYVDDKGVNADDFINL